MADNRKYYYLKLYLKSLKNGGKLQLDEHIPYTAQMIATLTRQQVGTVERALQIFLKLGLVEQLGHTTRPRRIWKISEYFPVRQGTKRTESGISGRM